MTPKSATKAPYHNGQSQFESCACFFFSSVRKYICGSIFDGSRNQHKTVSEIPASQVLTRYKVQICFFSSLKRGKTLVYSLIGKCKFTENKLKMSFEVTVFFAQTFFIRIWILDGIFSNRFQSVCFFVQNKTKMTNILTVKS